MLEEALQIAETRREVTGKGEKQRRTLLNAKFQRIARRDKKASLSDMNKFCNMPNGKHYQEAKTRTVKTEHSNSLASPHLFSSYDSVVHSDFWLY